MEELLNKLIEKGWKPFGREARHELSSGVVYDTIDFKGKRDIRVIDRRHHHIRELVAKESGLWQFVCKNMLINKKWFYGDEYCIAEHCEYTPRYYKFRLIESALCDEDKLEEFLLENIKL